MPLSNAAARDIATVTHSYSNPDALRANGPVIMSRGRGVFLEDVEGRDYIDVLSGLWCVALGHGNEEIADAIAQQARRLSFAHIFGVASHDLAAELAEKLIEIAPHDARQILFCCSGSEANDQQIKLLRYFNNARGRPDKKRIISHMRGYHGVTLASASLCGLPHNHREFDLPLDFSLYSDCPHHYRYAHDGETEDQFSDRLRDNLKALIERENPDTIAAFIAEPVMGAGGAIIPPKGYYEKITPILERHDIRFISDEVICGFGRTGEMFGATTLNMRPQAISFAKAATSAYQPLGGVSLDADMVQAIEDQSRKVGMFGHGYTYSCHPVAASAALKALEIYERDRIVEQVQARAPQFAARMARLGEHPLVGNARALGLIGAIELAQDKRARKHFAPEVGAGALAIRVGLEKGLFSRALGDDILPVCPPLIISESELDMLFDRLEATLDETMARLAKDGHAVVGS